MPNLTVDGIERAEERRRSGPTRHEINTDLIFDLAKIGMSQQQIANYVGISLSTFTSNQDWVDIFNEGKGDFANSIISKQFQIAMDDNHRQQATMLLHLGKTALGQREPIEQKIEVNTSSFEELMKIVDK